MSKTKNYQEEATEDAQETARYFLDEIIESFMDKGEASDDLLNDYSDSYHHENHVDKWYSLQDAAQLLDELDDYEETDTGLWEGQPPKDAISTQAAFTYGNAVYQKFQKLIKEINDDDEACQCLDEYNAVEDNIDDELTEAEDACESPGEYEPPFEKDQELEHRQELAKANLKSRIENIIEKFND